MTDWTEHPDHPDLYYRREGRTVHLAGRDVVEGKPRISYDHATGKYSVPVSWDTGPRYERTRPVIHVSAEAAAASKRLTLAELAAFVDQAKAAGVPDAAGLNVTTKGIGHLRKIRTEDGAGE